MNETNEQAQFKTEGQPAFPVENKENDNSSDSPSVDEEVKDEEKETDTDQTQSSEGEQTQSENKDDGEKKEGNFTDHPRWKEREDEWKKKFNDQEQRHTKDIDDIREDIAKSSNKGAGELPPIPSWFGGDEKQWASFMEWNKGNLNQTRDEALKGVTEKEQANQKLIDNATAHMNEQVGEIQNDKTLNPQGIKVDRNKLLKTAIDNDLVTSDGKWNYKAAWQMMNNQDTASNAQEIKDKKDLAGATTSENKAEAKKPDHTTSKDFENPANRPW